MDLVEIRLLAVLGILLVGVAASVGAVAGLWMAPGLVRTSPAVAGWLGRVRGRLRC